MDTYNTQTHNRVSPHKKNIIIIVSTLVVGILLGWIIFGGSGTPDGVHTHDVETHDDASLQDDASETWTCSMHPQIRQGEPGDCPICGMDLIPVAEEDGDDEMDPGSIRMSATAMKLANVSTARVGETEPVKLLQLNGKVESDERQVVSQSSHIPGRIEKLMVNFTGDFVREGQPIAYIYSPDLVTAQEELLEAQKTKATQPQLFNAAQEKLKNWKLSQNTIDEILASGKIMEEFPVTADVSGYVTKKMVNRGDYIARGKAIYEITDLSTVWILFDVYEGDMPWIAKGDSVEYTIQALPGETFNGVISFIDPMINPSTRVAKARVETSNRNLKLKPKMFVSGTVEAKLPNRASAMVVPKSAVMWTGKRSVVYVKSESENGVNFIMRTITLGPSLGESYIVESGINEGEEIAVHGTFSIDAAAQLAGKPSMMSPEGGAPATGHDHGAATGTGAEMDDMDHTEESTKSDEEVPTFKAPKQFREQLTNLFTQYLGMKDAYVKSDAQQVATKAEEVLSALSDVDMALLEGEAHMYWMKNLDDMEAALENISNSGDLGTQRKEFISLNPILRNKIKAFGLEGTTAYYQFCPMANDDQGAFWLSDSETIRNPYYGDMMLECGEVEEVLGE